MDRPNFKILRSPSLKQRQCVAPIAEMVKLERVLGLTITSNAALSVDCNTGTIAYPAGCVVVLYNPKKGKQKHIFNSSKKTLTCLAFSGDGKHLVTGESGHKPAVRVWCLDDNVQVAEFQGHKFGISCVAFSPNLKYIVSIGTQHDMIVNVWNWKTNIKVASNKVASKVTGVAFSEDGRMFVTVGNRHVKFWYLDASKSEIKTETLPLQGRNGILGEHQNNFFCGVCCGKGQIAESVYAITESGLLCEFDQKRLLVKWVSLRTDRAYAVCLSEEYIFIGYAGGLVRVLSSKSLNFLATLPRPHHLGVDVSVGLPQSNVKSPDNSRFPDTIAVQYDDVNNRLTCVYNDHSLYVWDVTDVHKVAKTHSFLFHSGAIWGVDVCPESSNARDVAGILPPGSFVTCSSDNTIRIWNCSSNMSTETSYKRNIYCNELLKVLYVDPDLNNLLDIAYNPAGKTDKTDTSYQEKIGIRSVRFSPDGKHLASGDRAGNIRVHDLSSMQQIAFVEAHDSEVLCLEYSQPSTGVNLLATASRDRLLHVFDVEHTYGLVQTLDDHLSAITAIKFVQLDGQLLMLSCGADKSLLFRNAQMDPEFRFVLNRHLVSRTTLYDMEIDTTGKFVATACQDRNIRIYNTRTGKQKKCYSGSSGTEGTLLRVELDPSGHYAATSCSDKNLSIYDFFAGELVASMFGHSEISPGIKFLNDLKHVVSVSVDGCIFIWRLPIEFTDSMMGQIGEEPTSAELQNNNPHMRRETFLVPKTDPSDVPDANRNFPSPSPFANNQLSPASSDSGGQFYRFSVGQLPAWAKPRVQPGSFEKPSTPTNAPASGVALPKGKWARDVDGDPTAMKPFFNLISEENRSFDLPPSLTMQAKVSIIDDDELNQDDEVGDEFSPVKTHQVFLNPVRTGLKVEREISDNSSNSVEDEDEGETNETHYYMPNAIVDSDSMTTDSTFMVQENDITNFKEPMGVEGSDMVSAGEEEDMEQHRSLPGTPTEHSGRGSDIVSPDDLEQTKVVSDSFERQCNETFEETLKKLEDEITARFDSQGHLSTSRHSISSRFFDKSDTALTIGHQSHTAHPASMPKEFAMKFVDEGKRNLNEGRDLKQRDAGSTGSAGGTRRHGRSIISADSKSTNVTEKNPKKWSFGSNTMKESPPRKWKSMHDVSAIGIGPSTPVTPQPSRSKTPTLSLLSSKQESKGVDTISYATLPKTKGKPSRQSTDSAVVSSVGIVQKPLHSGTTQTLPVESESSLASQQKRKFGSKVQSYRMQTESSMAKLSLGETTTQSRTSASRRSVPLPQNSKYQSAPNLSDANEASGEIEMANDIKAVKDRILNITKTRQFSPVFEIDNEMKPRAGFESSADSSHSIPSVMSTSVPSGILDKNANRDPMPPPLTTEIPTSIQNTFLMKANKHRRSGAAEISLLNAKTAILEKEPTPIEAGVSKVRNLDVSPLDLPVRDSDYPTNRSELRMPVTTTAKSVATLGRLTANTTQKSAAAAEISKGEKPESVSSPKITQISRSGSPVRPYSTGPNDDHPGFSQRRVLPANPPSTNAPANDQSRSRSTSLGSDTTTLLTFRPETVEVPVTTNYSQVENSTVNSRASSAGSQSTSSSGHSQMKSGGSTLGRSSPFKMLLSSPDVDSKSAWMKKAHQMSQQWEQRQQKKGPNIIGIDSERISGGGTNETEELRAKEPAETLLMLSPSKKKTFEISDVDMSKDQRNLAERTNPHARTGFQPTAHLQSRSVSSDADVPNTVKAMPRSSFEPSEKQLRQRMVNLSANDYNIPKEGEPDTSEKYDSKSLRVPESEVANISSNGIVSLTVASHQMVNFHAEDTEKQCAKVASELTEAVTRARQMFTQLSSDSSYDDIANSHDRALKLLRETICEAKDQLTKTIDSAPSVSSADASSLATDERMFEMLECYSQKLYDLFKKKLEND